MQAIPQEFTVGFRYSVHFTQGIFDTANSLLADIVRTAASAGPRKTAFVLDAGLCSEWPGLSEAIQRYCEAYFDTVELAHAPLIVPGGEEVKNDRRYVDAVQQMIHDAGICRHSFIVAVGGGAVLDMVGYAAGTAHRGVRLIRVPTTVLAQNDSGVGVKNSVNAFGKKNFLGAFTPPFSVVNDSDFLATLSGRDWRSGISEAIKVALIKDADFFGRIERDAAALACRGLPAMKSLIHRCAEHHLNHIACSGDAFETGSSRPLDFGHWAAHKLEQLSRFHISHGEAVAIGIAMDVVYSRNIGLLDAPAAERILKLLAQLGFRLFADELLNANDANRLTVLTGLEEFREHLGGELTITLLAKIGRGVEVHEMDESKIVAAIHELKERVR